MNESAIHSAVIALPWPDRKLSPNSRVHHFARSRAAAAARKTAFALTWQAIGSRRPMWGRAALTWEFCPPSRRKYDDDNIIAACKAARDGISDALGIDDSRFISTYAMGAPVKGGVVNVTVRAA